MSWIEIRATLPDRSPDSLPGLPESADISPFVEIFRDFGVENTQEDGDTLIGCMVDVAGSAYQATQLAEVLRTAGAVAVSVDVLEEQNWAEVWKQFFKPRRVGNRFVVRPTWEEFASEPDDLTIVLDPGEAFGTGDHPTTRLCLELLEVADVDGRRVADIGCGSGILSIGACLLGAALVEAVDIEPASVEVAKENAALNKVSFRAILGEGVRSLILPTNEGASDEACERARTEWEQDELPLTATSASVRASSLSTTLSDTLKYDVVVSNIISAILMRIAADVHSVLPPGGRWIVSGIIQGNWPDVLATAEKHGFRLAEKREESDWVAAMFIR